MVLLDTCKCWFFNCPIGTAQFRYERHVDYLHYNPVKHGHVTRVADWPYSSFHRYVRSGIYNLEWAADDNVRRLEMEWCKRRDALRFPALRPSLRRNSEYQLPRLNYLFLAGKNKRFKETSMDMRLILNLLDPSPRCIKIRGQGSVA